MLRRAIAGALCLLIPELTLANLSNIATASYRDNSGNSRVVMSNTVTVVVNVSALPAPILSLPHTLPVNAQITASMPSGYVVTAYHWAIAPQTTSAGSSAAAASILARAARANFSTTRGMADLSPHNLTPGNYLISVTATDSHNVISAPAQANVTLVPADLSTVRVYPNPWRSDKTPGSPIVFDRLAANSTVKIFTVSGYLVKTLPEANNSVTWDLTTSSGEKSGSGIYLYLVTTPDGQTFKGRLAIIK